MKILIDATPVDFGGIRAYTEHLLAAWDPDDELHVAVRRGSTVPLPRQALRWEVAGDRVTTASTGALYSVGLPKLAHKVRPDVFLALRPALPIVAGTPTVVVSHDLRHRARPSEFSRAERVRRWVVYNDALRRATRLVAISLRAADELSTFTNRCAGDIDVVHHGADHVLGWTGATAGVAGSAGSAGSAVMARTGCEPYAIAFGHWTNKRVDLALAAWAELVRDPAWPIRRLRVLGLVEDQRLSFQRSVDDLGLTQLVDLHPFLGDADHRQALADASLMLMPSMYEGFGLPALELMALGVPVVVAPDSALIEVTAGHATLMHAWTGGELARAARVAIAEPSAVRDRARAHARSFTWSSAAEGTRAALQRAIA